MASQNGYGDCLPVVAYSGVAGTTFTNDYVGGWSASNYPTSGVGQDVWSRTMNAGTVVTTNYSRVNYNATGTQSYQSVAGRYSNISNQMGFCWYDDNVALINYLNPTVQAGSGALK